MTSQFEKFMIKKLGDISMLPINDLYDSGYTMGYISAIKDLKEFLGYKQ